MNAGDLKKRTKLFALRVLKLAAALPNTIAGKAIREGSSYAQVRQSEQTIAQPAAGDLELSS